jgi:hypothetical protein
MPIYQSLFTGKLYGLLAKLIQIPAAGTRQKTKTPHNGGALGGDGGN